MKKGTFNFLGRKNQSLFDTNVKMKDMDNVELMLESSATPELGTASVRARPTVKHLASPSFDTFQGFAVPTPTVPLLPHVNGPKINGSVGEDSLSSGSVISVHDLEVGETFIPPPPSSAPPPPPGDFIPPPPDFMGDLTNLDMQNFQSHSMEEESTFPKPQPMALPKPPSSGSASSFLFSSAPPDQVPEHPNFIPPPPPPDIQQKISKTPPPKPIRFSSISILDSTPQSPSPPPPVQTPILSTFNPQNTAKLYSLPQTTILRGYEDPNARSKQMLLLDDSRSGKSSPVLVQVDGNALKVAPPSKQVSSDIQELKENVQMTQSSALSQPEPSKDAKKGTVSAQLEIDKLLQNRHLASAQLQNENSTKESSESSKVVLEGTSSQSHTFSPLLAQKLRILKSSETSARDGPVASPLVLLMAAKERDKNRSTQTLSRENSAKKNEHSSASIQPSNSSPNSFIVTPRSSLFCPLTSQNIMQESTRSASPVEHIETVQIPPKLSSPALVKDQVPYACPSPDTMAASQSTSNLITHKQNQERSLSNFQSTQPEDNEEGFDMPILPPPPEFDNLNELMGPPPSFPPPDPPILIAPIQSESLLPPINNPSPPPKPQPPPAPKLPPHDTNAKPKFKVQPKPKTDTPQLPSNLSPSQVTLLSILQKKMLEMDNRISPVKELEPSSDDWGGLLTDDDNTVQMVPRATQQSSKTKQNSPGVHRTSTLDMKELENKVLNKHQETSSIKVPTSNGQQSKHKYGMTFTVRPGTTQPITVVSRGEC